MLFLSLYALFKKDLKITSFSLPIITLHVKEWKGSVNGACYSVMLWPECAGFLARWQLTCVSSLHSCVTLWEVHTERGAGGRAAEAAPGLASSCSICPPKTQEVYLCSCPSGQRQMGERWTCHNLAHPSPGLSVPTHITWQNKVVIKCKSKENYKSHSMPSVPMRFMHNRFPNLIILCLPSVEISWHCFIYFTKILPPKCIC